MDLTRRSPARKRTRVRRPEPPRRRPGRGWPKPYPAVWVEFSAADERKWFVHVAHGEHFVHRLGPFTRDEAFDERRKVIAALRVLTRRPA